jgi:hypothetical protein
LELKAKLKQLDVCLQKLAHPERPRLAALEESVNETGEFLSYPIRPHDGLGVAFGEAEVLVLLDDAEIIEKLVEVEDLEGLLELELMQLLS